MSFPPEAVERLQTPKPEPDPVRTLGNPTPLALGGLILCLSPLSCQLMEWRGAESTGIANIGPNFFCGGLLLLIGGMLEFFRGNTFAFVVFGTYGGFFLSLGATLVPGFGIVTHFANAEGQLKPQFYDTYAFFYLFTGMLSMVFLICSLRTNVVFVAVFLGYSVAFPLLAASDWLRAQEIMPLAHRLQVGGGAACFIVALLGWYAFASSLLEAVDFPMALPMGDLSAVVRGASEKKKAQARARGGA